MRKIIAYIISALFSLTLQAENVRAFIVGDGGISAEEFLSMDIRTLFK